MKRWTYEQAENSKGISFNTNARGHAVSCHARPNSSSYFTQLELGISGDFDLDLFEKSLNELVRTYDILRTAFVYQQLQKKPRQVVLAERHIDVYREDLSHLNHQEQKKVLDQYKKQVRKQGFHLTNDLLLKVAVFQLNETNWHLIWSNHHIIMDGWSMGVLMKKTVSLLCFLSERPNAGSLTR
ncbi:hypothetical protein BsIDN1_06640 [Bacillus safensis]|uniref:Condensation domain-containing protein n=1 Tax=Bacillus safensis TaxID=561879 RepID=A0A5S9M688_BACIA|nr:hypothetical protein BsIDN1_06640 [Bacillus safensis]